MSKQSEDDYHASEEKEQIKTENTSKEESVEDISPLISSAQLLTECSSQLTPERKAEILQTFLFLSEQAVNQPSYGFTCNLLSAYPVQSGCKIY
jgi:hypothetical protein